MLDTSRLMAGAALAWATFIAQTAVIFIGLFMLGRTSDSALAGVGSAPYLVVLGAVIGLPLVALVLTPAVAISEITLPRRSVLAKGAAAFAIAAAVLLAVALIAGPATGMALTESVVLWLMGLLLVPLPMVVFVRAASGARESANTAKGRRSIGQWMH